MNITHVLPRGRFWLAALALIVAPVLGSSAFAQDDPPGRVGRLAEMQGVVSWYDSEQGVWADAERNRPLTTGDRLSTGARTTAEIRVGSTVVRLSEATELELMRIDDERIALRLHRGSLALQVRAREVAAEIDLITAEATVRPQRAGLYRLDRIDDTTQATALRGALRIVERDGFTVERGQRVELWREGADAGVLRSRFGAPVNDGFAVWIAGEDRRDERSASVKYVSPEMTGAEELDRHGRWDQHPEHGALWFPIEVRDDWAPYRYGRWAWVQPWGWTWVDDARWGFAPFHYGRWVHWRGRWGWSPGQYVARPVYAPALVAWVGGPHIGVSIRIGAPAVSWVPLAPREIFRPYYRVSPRYEDRVNHRPYGGDLPSRQPQQVPTGPIMYRNQDAPGALTSVSREVMTQRQPVAPSAIEHRGPQRERAPLSYAAPPVREFLGPVPVQPPQVNREQRPVAVQPVREQRAPPVAVQPAREQRTEPVAVQPARESRPEPVAVQPAREQRPEPVMVQPAMPMPAPERAAERERRRESVRDLPRDEPRDVPQQRPVRPSPAPVMPSAAAPMPAPAQAASPAPAPVAAQPAPPRPQREAASVAPQVQPAPQLAPQPAAGPQRPRTPEGNRRPERDEERKNEKDVRGNPRERDAQR